MDINQWGKHLNLVILDWAGTTMDYGCLAPMEAFREVFSKFGVPITVAEARAPMGAHKKVHIQKITENPEVRQRWQGVYGKEPTEQDVEAMFRSFVPIQLEILPRYADLIPGTLETVAWCRRQGLKIGSTTGYTREMMSLLCQEAKRRGYEPDATVCADDVPEGRPAPWMCLRNAERLGVYPMSSIVKVGDTVGDILEGRNAGMWTVGLTLTGNEVGLAQAEVKALALDDRYEKWRIAKNRLVDAGAHETIETIAELPRALYSIYGSILDDLQE